MEKPKMGAAIAARIQTTEMQKANLSWGGIWTFAVQSVDLLEKTGPQFLDLIQAGFTAFKGLTTHDFTGILTALKSGGEDVQGIIAAIKEEFQLS